MLLEAVAAACRRCRYLPPPLPLPLPRAAATLLRGTSRCPCHRVQANLSFLLSAFFGE